MVAEELDVSFEGDFTFALKCNEWPPIANEWKTRSRAGVWPSSRLVQVRSSSMPYIDQCNAVFYLSTAVRD